MSPPAPGLADLPTCLTARVAALLDDAADVAALAAALRRPAVSRVASRPGLLEDAAALRWRDAWRLARVPEHAAPVARSYETALCAALGVPSVAHIVYTPSTGVLAAALAATAADGAALKVAARSVLSAELGPEPPMLRRAYRGPSYSPPTFHGLLGMTSDDDDVRPVPRLGEVSPEFLAWHAAASRLAAAFAARLARTAAALAGSVAADAPAGARAGGRPVRSAVGSAVAGVAAVC